MKSKTKKSSSERSEEIELKLRAISRESCSRCSRILSGHKISDTRLNQILEGTASPKCHHCRKKITLLKRVIIGSFIIIMIFLLSYSRTNKSWTFLKRLEFILPPQALPNSKVSQRSWFWTLTSKHPYWAQRSKSLPHLNPIISAKYESHVICHLPTTIRRLRVNFWPNLPMASGSIDYDVRALDRTTGGDSTKMDLWNWPFSQWAARTCPTTKTASNSQNSLERSDSCDWIPKEYHHHSWYRWSKNRDDSRAKKGGKFT
jgi:DNA-directed RNA polymerase subunit RPC12/RpoP